MIRIKLGNIPIEIENQYTYIERSSQEYITDEAPLIRITSDDIDCQYEAEQLSGDYSNDYVESLAIYRAIAEKIPSYGGMVFHGAVIAYEGRAYAVTAHSGVGKSTHLALWEQVFGKDVYILNGDKPIILETNGVIYAVGTPWRGKENLGVNKMLPLSGIAFLARDTTNHWEILSAEDALGEFFGQVYMPKSPTGAISVMRLADRVMKTVPFYRLFVNISPEAAKMAFKMFTNK